MFFVVLGPVFYYIVFRKYKIRIQNREEIRKKYKEIMKEIQSTDHGPTLICSNHLTYVDSIIQTAALSSGPGHFLHQRRMPWHLPEKTNFYTKTVWRAICYLGRCIPVLRGGPKEETQRSLEKMQYILGRGDIISIFPEGGRSRTGNLDIDNYSYSVGQILKRHDKCRIICIYMREDDKDFNGFAKYPRKDADYAFDIDILYPSTELKGSRRVKDLSSQIMNKLKDMEDNFFSLSKAHEA
jgi:1-acyl-sn-glycerol-3-phosphate acyltransferase